VKKVYLDTTVISALFDERTPERMAHTKAAWEEIKKHDVYISDIVLDELRSATSDLADKFDKAIEGFNVLATTEKAEKLANIYVEQGIFPEKYFDDALHVALASTNEIGILISWNFRHLVKIKTRKLVAVVNALQDYQTVEIIAPPEL
jgi:predicted nucleic acid-binding protein